MTTFEVTAGILHAARTTGHANGGARQCALRPPRLSRPMLRERRAPALWRCGEIQLDRFAAGARARLDGEFLQAGLEDERRDPLGAVDADPGAEHPATCAVATRVVRCQSEAFVHHANVGSDVARGQSAVNGGLPRWCPITLSAPAASPRVARGYSVQMDDVARRHLQKAEEQRDCYAHDGGQDDQQPIKPCFLKKSPRDDYEHQQREDGERDVRQQGTISAHQLSCPWAARGKGQRLGCPSLVRVDGLEPLADCPARQAAGHLSGSDRAALLDREDPHYGPKRQVGQGGLTVSISSQPVRPDRRSKK